MPLPGQKREVEIQGPGFPLNYAGPVPSTGSRGPIEVFILGSVGREGPRGSRKQAQVLGGKVQKREATSTLPGPPRHTGRCGPPRLSGVQWWTPLQSPVGRSQSTRLTTGAVWHQTSGLGPARQNRSRGHLVGCNEPLTEPALPIWVISWDLEVVVVSLRLLCPASEREQQSRGWEGRRLGSADTRDGSETDTYFETRSISFLPPTASLISPFPRVRVS